MTGLFRPILGYLMLKRVLRRRRREDAAMELQQRASSGGFDDAVGICGRFRYCSYEAVMTIGSSPFLTADVDETLGFNANSTPVLRLSSPGDIVSARIELIRRRVLAGYYASPAMATEIARRLLEVPPNGQRK